MKHRILFLNASAVEKLYPMKSALKVVRKAFTEHAEGKLQMPPKVYLDIPEHQGDFRAMPARDLGRDFASLKWVNSHSNNREKGLPAVMATLILNDAATGLPLAFLDASTLTNLRTGAAGGVAVDLLARSDARVASFIGCGAQARFQLEALLQIRKIKEVRAYDPSPETLKKFEKFLKKRSTAKFFRCSSAEEACRITDILITTTPGHGPVIESDWVAPGTHLNAIGADASGKQELDPAILNRSRVYLDDVRQAAHSGEINMAIGNGSYRLDDIAGTLGDVLSGKKGGRSGAEEITLFDSTGLAIQDLASAIHVYREATRKKAGQSLKLF